MHREMVYALPGSVLIQFLSKDPDVTAREEPEIAQCLKKFQRVKTRWNAETLFVDSADRSPTSNIGRKVT